MAPAEKRGDWGPPRVRWVGRVHWRGLWTHSWRNMRRFLREGIESVLGPVAAALLFFLVLSLAVGETFEGRLPISFAQFLVPGLAMAMVLETAFHAAAVPIIYDKLEGMIGDLLSSPLSSAELAAGYVVAGALCGLVPGAVALLVMSFLAELPFPQPWLILVFAPLGSLIFALLGALAGLWAEKWDYYSAINTFMVLPLGFLSGAFFSASSLPPVGQSLLAFNPAFYLIDGVRRGVTGYGEAALATGAVASLALVLLLAWAVFTLFRRGYKIKA